LSDAADQIAIQIVDVQWTTLAGVIALLRYTAEYEQRGNDWPSGLVEDGVRGPTYGLPWSFFPVSLYRCIAVSPSRRLAARGA
jgi:hypothetical protein